MTAPHFLGSTTRPLTPPDVAAFEQRVRLAYDVLTNPASHPGSIALARLLLIVCGRSGVRR